MKKLINGFTVGIVMTLISLVVYFSDLPFFEFMELKAYDIKLRLRGVRPVSGNIAIVAIDEKSLKEQGRWPWSRCRNSRLGAAAPSGVWPCPGRTSSRWP